MSVKEFTFQKFADLKPTALPKMSPFKVVVSRIFPTLLFFHMNAYFKGHI